MKDQELLKYCNEHLNYDPDSGVLTWKKRVNRYSRAKIGSEAGGMHPDGAKRVQLRGSKYLYHRLAFLMHYGWVPKFIDHKDTVRDHNWISNLRPCTHAENQRNSPMYKTNTSGYKGVSLYRDKERWRTSIQYNGSNKHIGIYKCKHEAARAYNLAARMYHGKFAYTNEISI